MWKALLKREREGGGERVRVPEVTLLAGATTAEGGLRARMAVARNAPGARTSYKLYTVGN